MDRIDIHIELPAVKYKELIDTKDAESSFLIKSRIEKAKAIQRERFQTEGVFSNAQMKTKLVRKYCILADEAQELLKMAMTELGLSARAYDKILKVSGTIADLANSETILAEHISGQCSTGAWIGNGSRYYLPNTSFNMAFAIFSAKSLLPLRVQWPKSPRAISTKYSL